MDEQENRTHQNETLTVHFVPHTHTDAGWLKTFDEYYSGTYMDKSHSSVKSILNSVIDELLIDETRKFTYVDMKFFWTWYRRLD